MFTWIFLILSWLSPQSVVYFDLNAWIGSESWRNSQCIVWEQALKQKGVPRPDYCRL